MSRLTGSGTGGTLVGNATNFTVGGLTLTAAGSGYTGTPTVTVGVLGGATPTLSSVNLATDSSIGGSGNIAISGAVTGAGLTKVGAGMLTLSGANTHTAATTVSQGTLALGNVNAIANSTLDTGASGTQAVTFTVAGTNTYNLGGLKGTDDLAIGANTISVGANGENTSYGGAISGTSGNLTKTGIGTMKLTSGSSYTGTTTISQGTLEVTANDALGSNAAGTSVTSGAALKLTGVNYTTTEAVSINGTGISNGGALVNSGTSTFAGQVTAATNASINAGGGTLTLTGGLVKNGTTATIMGGGRVNISGTGISGASANSDLVVDGTTLVVSAASNYNGPTTVQNSGTFVANAQIDTTSMTVSANSTLSGTGKVVAANNGLITINGALVVGDSTITPVASMLDLDTSGLGSAVLASTSKFYLDLFADAGDNTGNTAAADRLRWFGTLTIDGLAQLYINDSTGSMAFAWGDKWIIGDLTNGTLGGTYSDANIHGPALSGGWFWHAEQVGNAWQLIVVPEPSRALLLMLGMSGLTLRRRRRQ